MTTAAGFSKLSVSEGPALHIYIIHTDGLTQRFARINALLETVRSALPEIGYTVQVNFVSQPSAGDILANMGEIQKRICYDAVSDPEFDGLRQMLSAEMLSNAEKHRDVWRKIADTQLKHKDDLFLVLEDDAFLLPTGIDNLKGLLLDGLIQCDWDIAMLGICRNNAEATGDAMVTLKPFTDIGRVLLAKESYLIKPALAKRLADTCLDVYRFTLRIQLSYWLTQQKDVRVMIPTKPIMMDGSKIGICPSSIHANNILIFNREYMEMYQILGQGPEVVSQKYGNIVKMFKALGVLKTNPDMLHLYGILQYKSGRLQDAEETLHEAIDQMRSQQGIMNNRSELLNNMVQIYQFMQKDVPDSSALRSKYDDPVMALSDVASAQAQSS